MAGVKDLKKKIKVTKSTFKITSAMKLVSAAKLSRAQHAISSSRPYNLELEATIQAVSALVQNYNHSFLNEKEEDDNSKKFGLLLVVSSDKGLCGSYNSQLSKEVRKFLKKSEIQYKVYFIGKKVRELLKNEVNEGKHYKFAKGIPTFNDVKIIAQELASTFTDGEVGEVRVAYNEFKSAIQFFPRVKKVLPMSMSLEQKEELRTKFAFDFKYEPSPREILDTLIPDAYNSSIYTCLLDAVASEHGSRMNAMDSASKNCKEAIKTLTIKMNKIRQAAITTELIEVVSGAESLNS